jgi:Fic family protein
MQNRAGSFRTNLSGELTYRSFIPNSLPPNPKLELDESTITLLIKANRSLAKLNEVSIRIPNIPLFVSLYIRKEALLSSQIEGTQATLDDIFDPEIEKNTNQNVEEVINYIKAVDYAEKRMETLPICSRLLLETHEVLLNNSRGSEKNPGEFRTSQNWIGPGGSTLKTARYIPPNVEDMNQAMSDLEKYIHMEDNTDILVKIALIHYQFETIHPFLDGNGRIGRLMINLLLKQQDLLKYPTLYVSYFLKRNRIEYYDRLTEVRMKGNYEQWILFFLQAIDESAQDAMETIELLSLLQKQNLEKISNLETSTKSMIKVFEYIEKSPIIDIGRTSAELRISFNTVSEAVNRLVSLGILQRVGETRRGRYFIYKEYLEILKKDT